MIFTVRLGSQPRSWLYLPICDRCTGVLMVELRSPTTGGGLIVTGGSRGIGAEICRLAAQRGWSVCVNYRNSHDEAAAVVDQIRTSGGVAVAVRADVSVEAEVSTMFDQVEQDLGPVKGLVNNAGVNGGGTRVDDLDVDASRRVFEVNVLGAFLCAKYAVKRMAKRHGGSGGVIVNVSSAASKHGGPGTYTDYAASKLSLIHI